MAHSFPTPKRSPRALPALAAAALLAGCATDPGDDAPSAASARRTLPPGATAPLFGDLGDHRRPVRTASPMAQRYFDQGLVLTYGFNHAEAARSFREAQRLDPTCAMCLWGEAYVLGPNINKPMDPADAPRAREASQAALRAVDPAAAVEHALVTALAERYAAEPPDDRAALDRAYADAMREVAQRFPDDADVQALFAEALMDTMPWDYYLDGGEPRPETREAMAALERALALAPRHPGAIHYYIHAVEPERPDLAEAPADRLRDLVPGAGHLVHMPSHIYLRVGRYHDASIANEKAASADESYITQCRAQGFYPAAYYPHNIDFLQASAAFEGRSRVSVDAARRLVAAIPPEQIEEYPLIEEFLPKHLYALARFGRWDEILAAPEPAADLRYLRGAWHYARGLASAARGDVPGAEAELAAVEALRDAWARESVVFQSGAGPDQLLGIAADVLAARIAEADARWDDAIARLREAVAIQDALPYTEPPPWYFPVREALGEAFLQAGRPAEAEAVFRRQLEYTPRNGWSLFGLAASLDAQGKTTAAAEARSRFDEAWSRADVSLTSAVF